jgi:uncharacterized phage infection (PIP) family protein YhgE
MLCTQCGKTIPDQSIFCLVCGHKLSAETIEEIGKRVADLERAEEKRKGTDQKYLETDTTEHIAARLILWAKWFAACVGIPLALMAMLLTLAAVLLGIYLHKNISDARDLSETIHGTIQRSVDSARSQADTANNKANEAVHKATEIGGTLDSIKGKLNTLNDSIDQSRSRVEKLDGDISKSRSKVDTLDDNILQNNKKVQQYSQKVTAVMQDRNAVSIGHAYPSFGEHTVVGSNGGMDVRSKKPDDIYIDVLIVIRLRTRSPDARLQQDVSNFITTLQNNSYTVFVGGIALGAFSGNSGTQLTSFNEGSCGDLGHLPAPESPCILSLNANHPKEKAVIVKAAQVVQPIATDHIKEIDASQMDALKKELTEKSGMDFVVVFDAGPSQ